MTQRRLRSLLGTLVAFLVIVLIQRSQLASESPRSDVPAQGRQTVATLDIPLENANTSSTLLNGSASSTQPGWEAGRVTTTTHFTPNAHVVRVVDGDTIVVLQTGQTKEEKVRMLGVNTPESVDPRRAVECFGKDASQFLRIWIEGKEVYLAEDAQADARDKYQRLLRNVYLPDGIDVNASLIGQGYAYAYTDFPLNKVRKQQLVRLQAEAKSQQRGLWNTETCNGQKK